MSYIEKEKAVENVSQIRLKVVGSRAAEKTIFTEALRIYRDAVLKSLNEAPTADVVEVRHGEWKAVGDRPRLLYECSECGETLYYGVVLHSNFCFNCGAKMDGERRENGKS